MKNCILILLLGALCLHAAPRDSVYYTTETDFYGDSVTKLRTDLSRFDVSKSLQDYNPVFHFPPIRQDTTGTCWCFSATSFLESECYRLGRGKIELSRMFTVYWEYVEKVRRFVQQKGDSRVSEGSQHNAVLERMKTYGAVRALDYTGYTNGDSTYNHKPLIKELKGYLDYVEKEDLWDKDIVIAHTRLILDKYMGAPPKTIVVDGEQKTPVEFLQQDLRLSPDDYVAFTSFLNIPFWTRDAYDVPDNWWHSEDYFNVPLPDFYAGIKNAIRNGYSVAIAGDVSEPGRYGPEDLAIIPTFDIPSDDIDQNSREFRYDNGTTGDDHGVHIVGYHRSNGQDWFLIKDSASSAFKGDTPGYYFFHGDYIKLKILAFVVHKDAVSNLLETFQAHQPSE